MAVTHSISPTHSSAVLSILIYKFIVRASWLTLKLGCDLPCHGHVQLWMQHRVLPNRLQVHLMLFFNIVGSPSAIISVEKNMLTCSSSGYPVPTITWYSCPGILKTYALYWPSHFTDSAPYRLEGNCSKFFQSGLQIWFPAFCSALCA